MWRKCETGKNSPRRVDGRAAAGVPGNLIQAAFGTAASTLLALSLRRSPAVRERFPRL